MKQRFKINRKVVNRNYDKEKIQEVISYARNLNERIIEYDKNESSKDNKVVSK